MKKLLFAALTFSAVPTLFAGPLTFDFVYMGLDSSGYTLTGQFQIDSAVLQNLLANPPNGGYPMFPMSNLESLSMTLTGGKYPTETYTAADFYGFNWDSAGVNFDFTKNLVGQGSVQCYYNQTPWGECGPGDLLAGDFTFFSSTVMTWEGAFEELVDGSQIVALTSLQEEIVPEPGSTALVLIGGLALLARMHLPPRTIHHNQ
jgi:hypothetical protein